MNGASKGTITTSGEIDLGTVLTEHQSLDNYATKTDLNRYLSLAGGTLAGSLTLGRRVIAVGSDTRYGSYELLLPWSSDKGSTWKYASIYSEGGNGWHNLVFSTDTSGTEIGGVYFDGNLSVSNILNLDKNYIKVDWDNHSGGSQMTFPTTSGTLALTSYVDNAKESAVEDSNNYTDGMLNNYFNRTAANDVFSEGPYVFVKILDKSVVNSTPLVPDPNMRIIESSVTAKVTFKAVLWRNSIDNTYKITMDLYCSSLSPSCTLKPKQLKLALTAYASAWRMPSVNTVYCCAAASSQLASWGYANWWVSNLTGIAFTDMTTNIGVLNGTGLGAPSVLGKGSNGNLTICYTFVETDTDHKNDNLSVYGFRYHVEIITNKTTL